MTSKKRIKILASVDDGSSNDMMLADMLGRYRIPTVFYIPIKTRDLQDVQIRRLAGTEPNCKWCEEHKGLFEVGAHTMTHPEDLKLLSDKELREEITGSKKALEMLVMKEVSKFCYPSGRYNDRVKQIVKEAGFKEARTVKPFCIDFSKDPFETHPTIHIHPEKQHYGKRTWHDWAKEKFEEVIVEGGRFELWGHSYEIFDLYHQEEFLEDFLWWMDERLKEIGYPREVAIPYFEI